ncbi:ATP-dependent DNA helicase [Oceanobacillus salinisoli]|uniref:ATP-dependent DNA helicase n=1 Tax=Oceanobacillus salinisoli TaxID=2678611 RepID=UPI0012E315D4
MNYFVQPVLAKGRTHFLCLERLHNHYNSNPPSWVNDLEGLTGDRSELAESFPELDKNWDKVNVKKCKYRECAFYEVCDFIDLRKSISQGNSVIVTNHDQLIANEKLKMQDRRPLFSDDTHIIVIDEAHNLEEKARSSLTESWKKNKLTYHLNVLDRFLKRSPTYQETRKQKQKIQTELNTFFQELLKQCLSQQSNHRKAGSETNRYEINSEEISNLITLTKELNDYNISAQLLDTASEELEESTIAIEEFLTFIEVLKQNEQHIIWIEQIGELSARNISINSVPQNVSEEIASYFFEGDKPNTILTSATISTKGETNYDRYDYLVSSTGLDFLSYRQLELADPLKSPFDYDAHSLLYIPSHLPQPIRHNYETFREKAIQEILSLIQLTEGRSMILFTSKEDMNFVYERLVDERLPWRIFVQQDGSSQNKTKTAFLEDEYSILLSTGTYWEGIDIPGPSLSNLIIFKLPFPVPDPILNYKMSLFGPDGFDKVMIPEMIIKLRQGLGRLIRKETDKGIASILDSRLSKKANKSYRIPVLESVPIRKVTEDFGEVQKFTKEIYHSHFISE